MRVLILSADTPGGLLGSYERAFRSLGFDVGRFCLLRAFERAVPGGLRDRISRRLLHGFATRRLNQALPRALAHERADLVFVIKGERLSAHTIATLRERLGAPIVNFYPDDPFSRGRANRLVYGPATLGAYDHCFTFARHLMPAYLHAGAKRVTYLPFARDPALHRPVADAPPPDFELAFVGNLDEERIGWLEAVADFRLAIFGEPAQTLRAVPRGSRLRRATYFPAAYGEAGARALARGAISLNVMREQNRLNHNMRSFEAPACGVFPLSQRTPELVELFREGEEIACFSDVPELREQAAYWLAHPEERRRVAAAAFRRVEHDTYARRAEQVLRALRWNGALGDVMERRSPASGFLSGTGD